MKHIKTETQEIDIVHSITCDKCGVEMIDHSTRSHVFDLVSGTKTYFNAEDNWFEGWSVDLCKTCSEWLKDFLLENGVAIHKAAKEAT